jgi:3-polyprenyl-4-hydroxybenzoate decarboxylase
MSNNQYNGIMDEKKRIILAITGASGAIYGLRSLEALQDLNIEVHLVVSPVGARILQDETGLSVEEIRKKLSILIRRTTSTRPSPPALSARMA